MGLASSQGRLLSITARLTSNEYESQQISNAKMRLASETQDASQDYISALNSTQFSMVFFDNNGNSVSTPLTVAALYEYNDSKNQYLLTNSSGKALINPIDAKNYEESENLEDFLNKYGLSKIFKNKNIETAYNDLVKNLEAKTNYDNKVEDYKTNNTTTKWENTKNNRQEEYIKALNDYKSICRAQQQGYNYTNDEIDEAQTKMENARYAFFQVATYDTFIEDLIATNEQGVYAAYQEYKSAKTLYDEELSNAGLTAATAYEWDDKTKAQWYTNLWYKINGSSSGKTQYNNYIKIDNKMLNSSNWVSDSIIKGTVNIESVKYTGQEMTLNSENDPFIFNLNGISWETQIYSSCPDIIESDDDKARSKAEAEYTYRTAQINAKDEKYQRKLNLLDTEHNALQTEYNSVKSALDKNMNRSFKTFQG